MRAQVTLIPNESKKLIAKAVARMEEVQNAFNKGMVAIHPSSSTIFIVEELLGKLPETKVWVCGVVVPKGACGSVEALEWQRPVGEARHSIHGPAIFPFTWVIEKGELKSGIPLGDILDRMETEDVYIKGVNAIDPNNMVGVLIGNRVEGGTIGLVMSRAKRQGFRVVFPVGLEKLIPIPIKQAEEEAALRNLLDYSMGTPCALLPCEGMVVTEPKAIELLTGATAIPISAGCLGGAEGAITMVIRGDEGQVSKAINYIEGVKGTKLPREVRARYCNDCHQELCSLRDANKPWC